MDDPLYKFIDVIHIRKNLKKNTIGSEPGYIKNTLNGFDYMINTLGQSLIIKENNEDLLLNIYAKCMGNTVTNMSTQCDCNNYRKNDF